ncbi:hypothetical protein CQW23_31315 [Capsicum baccatum]|uniref:F-box domain-containing protein n=1 Tax=Capsicum baccatum TaxID=33114 RepID=A0A2G2V7X5_CAPBA|nr:hypothetical protein CQW23_31315 [Capsicum baccatum]
MQKAKLHKRTHFSFGNLLTAILRKEDIEEEPANHTLPHNPKKVDLTKVKDAESTHGVNLTTAERHARDESFFRHLYGMTREMCGVGTYFEEPLDDDVPTDDDRRMSDSDVEENSDDDDSYDDSDEGGVMKVQRVIAPAVYVELPDLIIFRILSHLPLSSLHRFKCVCKLWSTLFLHPTFVYLRTQNSPLSHILGEDADILRQLDFDNPNRWWGFTTICRSSSDLHVQFSLNNIGTSFCRCRAIDMVLPPLLSDGRMRNNIQLFFRKGVAYCICFLETTEEVDDIQVDVVDIDNETYIGRTTFPRVSFFPELAMLHLLDWNGRLSFSQLLKDELHVLVLDDHTKLKWAERKRIIKLNFLKSSPYHKEELITFHACDNMSTLIFIWQHKDNQFFCFYDIYTGELFTSKMFVSSYSDLNDAEHDAALVAFKVAEFAFHRVGL